MMKNVLWKNLLRLFALLVILTAGQDPLSVSAASGCSMECEYIAGCVESESQCPDEGGLVVCTNRDDGCEDCDWAPRCVDDESCESGQNILCTPDQT